MMRRKLPVVVCVSLFLSMFPPTTLAFGGVVPEYCGFGEAEALEAALRGAPRIKGSLQQVQVFTRHGARTPVSPCGPYFPPAEDIRWDCRSRFVETPVASSTTFARTFNDGALGGTCQVGQLVDRGVDQLRELGAALRRVYYADADLPPAKVYARSSDLSRTRASAEALLASLLEEKEEAPNRTVALETTDFAEDWIYPNEAKCPRLRDLEAEAYADGAFVRWNAVERRAVARDLEETGSSSVNFGDDMAGSHLLDCVLSSACDSSVVVFPTDDKDKDKDGVTVVANLTRYAERKEFHKLRFNDGAYAKLVAAPLVTRAVDKARQDVAFVLWSGHDTTVMPLKVALGVEPDVDRWAPYAHALVLEVWRLDETHTTVVRALTTRGPQRLDGCDADVCPIADLERHTADWIDRTTCETTTKETNLRRSGAPRRWHFDESAQQRTSLSRLLLTCTSAAVQVAIGFAIGLRFKANIRRTLPGGADPPGAAAM